MLTVCTDVSEFDLLGHRAINPPPGGASMHLRTVAASFGLEDQSTGLLMRWYDKELNSWCVGYCGESGDTYFTTYIDGPRAHDAFLGACRLMLSACFMSEVNFTEFITTAYRMELL
jgi:hypothetical protein